MEAKEDIRRRLSVEDVVGGYVELKRAGRNFKALSPFKTEKTPSFIVSPDKQIWHDFSANKGGDIFSFVMEMEGVDFVGAMEILARKAGLDLSQYSRGSGQTAKLKKRLYEVLELSARYYHATLAKNPKALKYLRVERGYSADTVKSFRLGFSPSEGSALYRFLIKKKFTPNELSKAGLTVSRRGQPNDMFRGRIMVPLMDGQGQVIGFTARLLADEPNAPKYINTPQTLLYDKSRHVFGLHLAKAAIRQSDEAVLVEGNMDVVASHQANIAQCVATAGTALTRDHLQQLSRLTSNIKLAFDADSAGITATVRAIPLAHDLGLNLSIVSFGDAKDPDELIKSSKSAWPKALKKSTYVMDWLVQYFSQRFDISTAQGKRNFADQMAEVLLRLPDPIEREHYVKAVSEKTGVSVGRVEQKLRELSRKKTRPRLKQKSDSVGSQTPTFTYVDTFLGLLAIDPDTRVSLTKLQGVQLERPEQQKLLEELAAKPEAKLSDLKSDESYVKIATFRAEEYYGGFSSSARLADAMKTARRIAEEMKKKRMANLAKRMRDAQDSADIEKYNTLLKQVHSGLKED